MAHYRIEDESDRGKPPNLSALTPLAWLDPEQVCANCGGQARYSNAWGSSLYCSTECADELYEST
jgi:hypothetical protein